MRAHLSINVRSLKKSVEFYSKVFGVKPQKKSETYAKFDLKEPSLNFSMHEVVDFRCRTPPPSKESEKRQNGRGL